jgi:hypothetical protein
MGVIDHASRVAGVSRERAIGFIAIGMYLNVSAALDLPDEYSHQRAED